MGKGAGVPSFLPFYFPSPFHSPRLRSNPGSPTWYSPPLIPRVGVSPIISPWSYYCVSPSRLGIQLAAKIGESAESSYFPPPSSIFPPSLFCSGLWSACGLQCTQGQCDCRCAGLPRWRNQEMRTRQCWRCLENGSLIDLYVRGRGGRYGTNPSAYNWDLCAVDPPYIGRCVGILSHGE